MRHHNLQVTGSVVVNGLGLATTADLNTYTASADAKISTLQAFTASTIGRLNSIESVSASNIARINSLETTSASIDTLNTAQNNRLNSIEIKTGSLATTGSNTFIGTQTITGSLFISSDLIVQGSSSLQNITASAVSIGTNLINLNTANPAIRYAGLVIGDSGSVGGSGSFLYDSVQDEMLFIHRGGSSVVTSSVALMGPETYDNVGNEIYITTNRLIKGSGNEHLIDSNISDTGTLITLGSNTTITGTLSVTGTTLVSGSSQITFSGISSLPTLVSGSSQITLSSTTGYGSVINQAVLTSSSPTFAGITINGKVTATSTGVDGTFADAFVSQYSSNNGEQNAIQTTVSSQAVNSGFRFQVSNGGGSSSRTNVVDFKRDRAIFNTFVGIGIGSSTAYSPISLNGSNISWGETMTIYPSPSGYITLALRLEGADSITGTWVIGKESSSSIAAGTPEYLQIAKNGLTGGALHRADAVQSWNPSNGNALFGFNVGIGTTSLNANVKLKVKASSEGTGISTSSATFVIARTATDTQLGIGYYSTPDAWVISSTYGTDGAYKPLVLATSDTERMRIDTTGRVTRPNQPAFLAYSTINGFSVTGGSWYNISNALTEEQYDIGSNYSGGRFTAPVAGRYFFYAGGWSQINSNGERYAWCVQINGSGLTFISGSNYCITDSPLSGHSIVYNLAAGDYVDLLAFSSVSGTWGPSTHRVYWGGYLL